MRQRVWFHSRSPESSWRLEIALKTNKTRGNLLVGAANGRLRQLPTAPIFDQLFQSSLMT